MEFHDNFRAHSQRIPARTLSSMEIPVTHTNVILLPSKIDHSLFCLLCKYKAHNKKI